MHSIDVPALPDEPIDPYPVAALKDRYGLKTRQTVYTWIDRLQIKIIRQGQRAYIALSDRCKLDDLYYSLQSGQKLSTIVPIEPNTSQITQVSKSLLPVGDMYESIQLWRYKYETLRWLADHSIAISTQELIHLIGIQPPSIRFRRGSFDFVKCGSMGRQNAWMILKKDFD
jgi:hypothetical protein